MNGTENPRNSGTHATRERYDRLPVLQPPTRPPPCGWLSSGCIVISWNEQWKCKNVRVQGGTLIKREHFWSYQMTYTEVITLALYRQKSEVHGSALATPFNFWKIF